MGFFGERGVDVLDLTLLQKKGILRVKDIPREAEVIDLTKMDRDGFAPLTNKSVAPSLVSDAVSTIGAGSSNQGSSSGGGAGTFTSFWDAPVSASPSTVSSFSEPSVSSSSTTSEIDVRNFGVKIEDVEYKMERLNEKLLSLESKIDEIARNIR